MQCHIDTSPSAITAAIEHELPLATADAALALAAKAAGVPLYGEPVQPA